jgi:hypothetical protein
MPRDKSPLFALLALLWPTLTTSAETTFTLAPPRPAPGEAFTICVDLEPDPLAVTPCQGRWIALPDHGGARVETLQAAEGMAVELGAPALLRGRRVAPLTICASDPLSAEPPAGRLSLRVVFDVPDERNVRQGNGPLLGGALAAACEAQTLNPAPPAAGALCDIDAARPGRYLVFGRAEVFQQQAMSDYLAWKRRRGHVVTTVETTAGTTATAIRARIVEEYHSSDPVDFVVLVGDTDGAWPLPTHSTEYDHYYATVDGDDILADVAVGRLSVDNALQLDVVSRKIRSYESEPFLEDPAWLTRAGFTTGMNVFPNMMAEASRAVIHDLTEQRGYTEADTLFAASNSRHVRPWYYQGLSFYNYLGWIGMQGLTPAEMGAYHQGPMLPVVTLLTDATDDFNSEDDYCEQLLRAGTADSLGGAVAAIGMCTTSNHEPYTTALCLGFYGGLLRQGIRSVGDCLFHAKTQLELSLPPGGPWNANYSRWCNLMGDPGTEPWAGLPASLELSAPDTLAPGRTWLDVTVAAAGQPVAGATVCAFQQQDSTTVQEVATIGADGSARLFLPPLQSGELLLTITGNRLAPLLRTLVVTPAAADPTPLEALVDGGGELLPGRPQQELTFRLRNMGTAAMTNLFLTLGMDPEYGEVEMPAIPIAALAPGETSQILAGARVHPVPQLSDGQRLPMDLHVFSDQGSFGRWFTLPVAAPAAAIEALSYPQGPLQPGEASLLRLHLYNRGRRDAAAPVFTLSSQAEGIAIPQPVQQGADWPVDSLLLLDYTLELAAGLLPGQGLPLRLDWSSDNGERSGWSGLQAVAGSPQTTDPSGPDAHGYWVYEMTDTGYELTPGFGWEAISPEEMGPGQWLALDDDEDEESDALWVQLPFPFVYYGMSYDSLLVSSAGFVSFAAPGWYRSTYVHNRPLPGPVGPDAMIAPFWDNLWIPATGAGVATWHDEPRHRFTISWYGLRTAFNNGINSFQLILLDPAADPTPSGDGEFILQYLAFHDVGQGGEDVPYCTIGFMDHTRREGLTLRNCGLNTLPTVAAGSNWAGRALLVTTRTQVDEGLPGDPVLPRRTSLAAAWPNPFNPELRLRLEVADSRPLTLTVHDLQGRQVARLLEGQSLAAGAHELVWRAGGAASGIYVLRLTQDGRSWQRKVTLLK